MFENEKFCKLFYHVSRLFTVFTAILAVALLILSIMSGVESATQFAPAGICLVAAVIGVFLMKFWKNKL